MNLKELYEQIKYLSDNYHPDTEVMVNNTFERVRYPFNKLPVYNPKEDCVDIDGS